MTSAAAPISNTPWRIVSAGRTDVEYKLRELERWSPVLRTRPSPWPLQIGLAVPHGRLAHLRARLPARAQRQLLRTAFQVRVELLGRRIRTDLTKVHPLHLDEIAHLVESRIPARTDALLQRFHHRLFVWLAIGIVRREDRRPAIVIASVDDEIECLVH